MHARATFAKRANAFLWLVAAAGAGLIGVLSFAAADLPSLVSSGGAATGDGRVAYLQFGETADLLWLAPADDPDRREGLLRLPHAREFGVLPSLAPDGRRFAYTALPPETPEPTPETPADLWLAPVAAAEPTLLARGVDLLVPPVWSPDGGSVVARRSGTGFALVAFATAGGGERLLVASEAALFPVAFSPSGERLYYVALSAAGSHLWAFDLAAGAATPVARLAEGLTRDWALSPAGDRLAFLALNVTAERVSTRAFVLDLATGAVTPVGDRIADAFHPVWAPDGALAMGSLRPGSAAAGLLVVREGRATRLAGPRRGFDVPLAATADGRFIVRVFDGSSATDPGRPQLALVTEDGRRQPLVSGEVTLLGWIED